ncbi:uncharacterized protein LOC114516225 [Dendronephthya gigantea]|uniref:uncharacterized protein LOC114516225 n=1 Tax=Dendronephthya gigantea TaxID=151771 RepID=UPI001069ECE4|nr:uncharacterized protein LOC114516225 [Dendronephthya gigantea]
MEKSSTLLFLTLTLAAVQICASASRRSNCIYGVTVKDLLYLARISRSNVGYYAAKLKENKIDQTALGVLSTRQLQFAGITAFRDRQKILSLFSRDPDDCSSSRCQNKGTCRDGYRCFSCACDPKSGYYGPSCELKCPCLNSGVCKTTQSGGYECVCPPGYSGDKCHNKYLTEERLLEIEKTLQQVTTRLEESEQQVKSQDALIKNLQSRPTGTWQFHRVNEILNQLEQIQISRQAPTYSQRVPIALPKDTKAILISIFCHFYNHQGHAYLNYLAYQRDNDNAGGKAEGYNTHYDVHANTFYYEQMIPWNTALPNELVFRVTYSYLTGGRRNWYRVRLVGYITSP